ncbi:MAG TPA: rhomboid family intramembrane serine protease [Patescibacteria group bacterium]|nr:rhomboid family intramembrane serine protease [Patescibacteria group bacterium]
MKTVRRTNITTTLLLLATSMMYILDSLGGGGLSRALAIVPERVIANFELWRLVTFPFAVHSLSGLFSLIFSVYFLAPKLENIFPKLLFPTLLLLFVISQGLATMFFFPQEKMEFSGSFGMAFFIMSLSVFTQPRTKMPLWSNFRIRTVALVMILMSLASAFTIAETLTQESKGIFFYNTFSSGFGSLAGVITAYLYARFSQLSPAVRNGSVPRVAVPRRETRLQAPPLTEPFDMVLSEQPVQMMNAHHAEQSVPAHFPEEYSSDEERLNFILDKILEQGKSSLRQDEEDFLQEYSKRM